MENALHTRAQTMAILPLRGLIKRAKINNFQVCCLRFRGAEGKTATTYLFMIPITTLVYSCVYGFCLIFQLNLDEAVGRGRMREWGEVGNGPVG